MKEIARAVEAPVAVGREVRRRRVTSWTRGGVRLELLGGEERAERRARRAPRRRCARSVVTAGLGAGVTASRRKTGQLATLPVGPTSMPSTARIVPPWVTTSAGSGPAATSASAAAIRAGLLGDGLAAREAERRVGRAPAGVRLGLVGEDVGDHAARPLAGVGLDEALVEHGLEAERGADDLARSRGRARRGLEYSATMPSPRSSRASACDCSRPRSFRRVSIRPWKRAAAFSSVSPWRTSRTSFEPGHPDAFGGS